MEDDEFFINPPDLALGDDFLSLMNMNTCNLLDDDDDNVLLGNLNSKPEGSATLINENSFLDVLQADQPADAAEAPAINASSSLLTTSNNSTPFLSSVPINSFLSAPPPHPSSTNQNFPVAFSQATAAYLLTQPIQLPFNPLLLNNTTAATFLVQHHQQPALQQRFHPSAAQPNSLLQQQHPQKQASASTTALPLAPSLPNAPSMSAANSNYLVIPLPQTSSVVTAPSMHPNTSFSLPLTSSTPAASSSTAQIPPAGDSSASSSTSPGKPLVKIAPVVTPFKNQVDIQDLSATQPLKISAETTKTNSKNPPKFVAVGNQWIELLFFHHIKFEKSKKLISTNQQVGTKRTREQALADDKGNTESSTDDMNDMELKLSEGKEINCRVNNRYPSAKDNVLHMRILKQAYINGTMASSKTGSSSESDPIIYSTDIQIPTTALAEWFKFKIDGEFRNKYYEMQFLCEDSKTGRTVLLCRVPNIYIYAGGSFHHRSNRIGPSTKTKGKKTAKSSKAEEKEEEEDQEAEVKGEATDEEEPEEKKPQRKSKRTRHKKE